MYNLHIVRPCTYAVYARERLLMLMNSVLATQCMINNLTCFAESGFLCSMNDNSAIFRYVHRDQSTQVVKFVLFITAVAIFSYYYTELNLSVLMCNPIPVRNRRTALVSGKPQWIPLPSLGMNFRYVSLLYCPLEPTKHDEVWSAHLLSRNSYRIVLCG